MAVDKWQRHRGEKGNIAVIAAVSLTALIGMLALVVDGGYLYSTKDKYQNGVEAVALAAAIHICDGDYETVARQIALDNDIPYESAYLSVEIGYYDLGDEYEDFAEYKDFVADSNAGTPYNDELSDPSEDLYVYNNAVMVSLNAQVSTFLAGIFGKEEVAVSAKAVGVARRVGLLSFGDDPETSGILFSNWSAMSVDFKDTGVIHSNTDVEFSSTPSASLSGDTLVTAVGEVIGCPEGGACLSDEKTIYPETSLDDIMSDLYAEASSQGRVIELTDENFPEYDSIQGTGGRYDEDGNFYYKYSSSDYVFGPHDGDHEGAVYYFEGENPHGGVLAFKTLGGAHAKNLTIAAEEDLAFSTVKGYGSLYLGGNAEDMAYVYTMGNIGGPIPYNHNGAFGAHRFYGVFFRVGGYFGIRPSDGNTYPPDSDEYRIKIRVIAEGIISLSGRYTPPGPFYFRADFGPPCPPIKVGLGKLEPTTGG
jgi:hypothetical protein